MKRNALFAERGGGRRRRRRNIAIKAEGEEATATAIITNGDKVEEENASSSSEQLETTTERKTKGATPLLVVDLEKGTVKLAKNRRKDKARIQGALAAAVKRSEVKLNDMGSTKIGPLEEDDCMDATNLVMDLFF